MSDEEWVEVALTDDSVVVELLLRLNRARPHLSEKKVAPALQVDWTVRQRRSKPVLRHADALKKSEPTRASPTTPLTWSGATSVSGGVADGFEDSSLMVKTSDGARSKIASKNEVTTMKRPRRKKTLAELKEEESLLIKERRSLKDALATLRLTVEKQRAINGSLKKMKLDFQPQQMIETAVTSTLEEAYSGQPQPQIVRSICDTRPIGVTALGCNDIDTSHQFMPPNISCKLQEIGTLAAVRLLPDLNLPFQEDSSSEVLYGLS